MIGTSEKSEREKLEQALDEFQVACKKTACKCGKTTFQWEHQQKQAYKILGMRDKVLSKSYLTGLDEMLTDIETQCEIDVESVREKVQESLKWVEDKQWKLSRATVQGAWLELQRKLDECYEE